MTPNLGTYDRVARVFIGLALILAPLANIPAIWSSSLAAALALGVGGVLIVTSFLRFCPLYRLVGLSTCKL
ncbi:MAG: DUF2892 domain-containing protein [Pseudomonadota bacterium]